MDIRTFFVTQDREKSTDSVEGAATQESIDSVKGATAQEYESTDSVERPTTHSVPSSSGRSGSTLSGTFPNDLPVPVSVVHKQDIVVKGPTQPRNCMFPKRKFSNGNLSFNPAWYDAKEAQGWLEYSIESDKMYCFVCRLFESEVRERNESNWISIGICNWKKALEKIKNHYKSTQHKSAESARAHFLQRDKHIDVMLDSSLEELTRKQREIEMNRRYLARLVNIAKTLAKCGLPFRGHNEKKESVNRGNFLELVGLLSRWAQHLQSTWKVEQGTVLTFQTEHRMT